MYEITQEYLDYAQARDKRLRSIAKAIEIEAAMKDEAAFRIAIDALKIEAQIATDALILCNPADLGLVAQYQQQARVAKVMTAYLQGILESGRQAEQALLDEDNPGVEAPAEGYDLTDFG